MCVFVLHVLGVRYVLDRLIQQVELLKYDRRLDVLVTELLSQLIVVILQKVDLSQTAMRCH